MERHPFNYPKAWDQDAWRGGLLTIPKPGTKRHGEAAFELSLSFYLCPICLCCLSTSPLSVYVLSFYLSL
jgi:hypothetical protein